MDIAILSRWQFAITTVYHFFFVPLTLGLSVLVAIMETLYIVKGDVVYKKMAKFWGKLFVINFAVGTVTGLVQEFQFGMNWSEYSRYVGDIFGAPLAMDGLLAFFLESTFLGIWIFGWNRLSKKMHAATIWLVAIGANVSALWILIANSFMQHPVGYTITGGRALMTDFGALVFNPYVLSQFPHVVTSGLTTGAFFVLGISAWFLFRKKDVEVFQRSFKMAAITGLIATLGVIGVGHAQTQYVIQVQPMKLAAAEALWRSEDPASLSIFTIMDETNQRSLVDLRLPYALSLLAYNSPQGEMKGMLDLQAAYVKQYGEGNYIPAANLAYAGFHVMVFAGFAMLGIAALLMLVNFRPKWQDKKWYAWVLRLLPFAIALPYLANTFGWILTETGRQPWVVYGLLKTENAVSPILTPGLVLTSLIGFTLVYGILMVVDVFLLVKYTKAGPQSEDESLAPAEEAH